MKRLFYLIMIVCALVLMTACGGPKIPVAQDDSMNYNSENTTPAPVEKYEDSNSNSSSNNSINSGSEIDDDFEDLEPEQPEPDISSDPVLITEKPTASSLCDQAFTEVSPFSDGLAWVQYTNTDGAIETSVINTNGELIFTVDRKVDYYSPFVDGSAFYLYTIDPSIRNSLDNIASCIVDCAGNIIYSSEDDGVRIILGHGDGHFLAIEHVSNFDTDEWRFGSIDKYGNTLISFD